MSSRAIKGKESAEHSMFYPQSTFHLTRYHKTNRSRTEEKGRGRSVPQKVADTRRQRTEACKTAHVKEIKWRAVA